MRSLLITLTLAAVCQAELVHVHFENDINWQWQLGTGLDVSKPASAHLVPHKGIDKAMFFPDGPRVMATRVLSFQGPGGKFIYADENGEVWEPIILSEPMPAEGPPGEIALNLISNSNVESHTIGDFAIVAFYCSPCEGLVQPNTWGYVELQRIPGFAWYTLTSGIDKGIALPYVDYHPTAWGYFTETELSPGDFNADGRINAADYTTWRDEGRPQSDYQLWKEAYAGVGGSGAAIPEPASALLWLVALAIIAGGRRKA